MTPIPNSTSTQPFNAVQGTIQTVDSLPQQSSLPPLSNPPPPESISSLQEKNLTIIPKEEELPAMRLFRCFVLACNANDAAGKKEVNDYFNQLGPSVREKISGTTDTSKEFDVTEHPSKILFAATAQSMPSSCAPIFPYFAHIFDAIDETIKKQEKGESLLEGQSPVLSQKTPSIFNGIDGVVSPSSQPLPLSFETTTPTRTPHFSSTSTTTQTLTSETLSTSTTTQTITSTSGPVSSVMNGAPKYQQDIVDAMECFDAISQKGPTSEELAQQVKRCKEIFAQKESAVHQAQDVLSVAKKELDGLEENNRRLHERLVSLRRDNSQAIKTLQKAAELVNKLRQAKTDQEAVLTTEIIADASVITEDGSGAQETWVGGTAHKVLIANTDKSFEYASQALVTARENLKKIPEDIKSTQTEIQKIEVEIASKRAAIAPLETQLVQAKQEQDEAQTALETAQAAFEKTKPPIPSTHPVRPKKPKSGRARNFINFCTEIWQATTDSDRMTKFNNKFNKLPPKLQQYVREQLNKPNGNFTLTDIGPVSNALSKYLSRRTARTTK